MTLRISRRVPAPLLALAALATLLLAACSGGETTRVLQPESAALVERAFATLAPAWQLADARIEQSVVEARVCPASGAATDCRRATLSDPEAGCADGGVVAGPFCVRFPDGAPPAALASGLAAALTAESDADPWREALVTPPPPTPDEESGVEAPSLVRPVALALATLLGPILVGFLAGAAGVRIARARGASTLARRLWVAPFAVAALAGAAVLPFGLWDRLLTALLVIAGLYRGTRPPLARALLRRDLPMLASVLATLGLLELGARTLLPPTPAYPGATQATLTFLEGRVFSGDEESCALVRPAASEPILAKRLAASDGTRPVVLHVGDSMLMTGVPWEANAPSVLAATDREVAHVSLSAHGTGPEFHWLILRLHAERIRPALVVLHICMSNDVEELGRPYPCCAGRGLVTFESGAPVPRCLATPEDSLGEALRRFVEASPPPYALRVATDASAFARHLAGVLYSVLEDDRDMAPTLDDQWSRFEAVIRGLHAELAARGVPLVMVLTPNRPALSGDTNAIARATVVRERDRALCQSLGVPFLDSHETFTRAAAAGGVAPLFVGSLAGDVHMSVAGHRLYADWLQRELHALPVWPAAPSP